MDSSFSKPRDYQLLSKIFSRTVITELAKKNNSPTLERILKELGVCNERLLGSPLSTFFENCYNELIKNYRNEYVFKNAIAEKIIRGKHKLSNTTYITEFKVGSSIADVAVFNGTSTAYEIKTEYDSFERLDSQLEAYSKAFERIYVVVPSVKVNKVLELIPAHVGVIELTERYSLSTIKTASSNIEGLDRTQLLNCMRPSEYIKLIKEKFHYIPAKSPSQQKIDCMELFSQFDIKSAHQEFVHILKARQLDNYEKKIIKKIPRSLISSIIGAKLSKKLLFDFHTCIMKEYTI